MEAPHQSGELPEAWKRKFASMRPIIPAIFHILPPLAVIMIGSFGGSDFTTPWKSVNMNLVSGTSLLILVLKKQTVFWEKWTSLAVFLSLLVAFCGVALNFVRFVVAASHHPGLSYTELIYLVNTAELTLGGLELFICAWIVRILRKTRDNTLVHKEDKKGSEPINADSTKNSKSKKIARPRGCPFDFQE